MNVQKLVVLNRVEPSPLSLRVPMSIDTRMTVTFLEQTGQPVDSDLAAQLQLTARSTDSTNFYSMPATDLVNGKATATIPAGDITDINGYRLNVTGTVRGEPWLLATGTLMPIAAAGPEPAPVDVIDSIDLAFERGEDANIGVKLWADDGKDSPYDLTATGSTVAANIYDQQGGVILVPFSVTVVASNEVQLYLTANQVNALPDLCWWNLSLLSGAGSTVLCEGAISVAGVPEPPFTTTVLVYTYIKQDALVAPAAGQIIHSNYALDLLRISSLDFNGLDQSALLNALILGDTIQIGVTTWSISYIARISDFYEVAIAPNIQASVSGQQNVTFARP